MKTKLRLFYIALFITFAPTVFAQTDAPAPGGAAAPPSAPPQLSEADLEKLVAPIALYPDPLLATLLPASAYPIDIVKAARFIANTNNIPKIDSQPWDSNVKALARFPDVIKKMNDDLDWTTSLGEAFANNQKSVMDAIQVMREKAQQAGTLKTTPQQTVTVTNTVVQQTVNQEVVVVTNTVVQIVPTSPGVIYVPTYSPTVVYGTVAYGTPVVYGASPGTVAAASAISFGVGMTMGAIMANNCNWHSGGVYVGPRGGVAWSGGYHGDVNVNRNVTVNNNLNRSGGNRTVNNNNVNRTGGNRTANNNNFNNASANRSARQNTSGSTGGQKWQADPSRREASPRSSPASSGWSGGNASAQRDAFNNSGGASQARSASQRGSSSRTGGQFNGARQSGGARQFNGGGGGARRSGGGFRGGGRR